MLMLETKIPIPVLEMPVVAGLERMFKSLTKRTVSEIGSACAAILPYVDALENANLEQFVERVAGAKLGSLELDATALKELNLDVDTSRREIMSLRGLVCSLNPTRIIDARGPKVLKFLRQPGVAADVKEATRAAAKWGMSQGHRQRKPCKMIDSAPGRPRWFSHPLLLCVGSGSLGFRTERIDHRLRTQRHDTYKNNIPES
eukprot:3253901-Amphidinium_carterae.1